MRSLNGVVKLGLQYLVQVCRTLLVLIGSPVSGEAFIIVHELVIRLADHLLLVNEEFDCRQYMERTVIKFDTADAQLAA